MRDMQISWVDVLYEAPSQTVNVPNEEMSFGEAPTDFQDPKAGKEAGLAIAGVS